MQYADERRAWLASIQNPDGGWGYHRGNSSWLEPTAWAALALIDSEAYTERCRRALSVLRSWQHADGSVRPHATIDEPSWATSLFVTLHLASATIDGSVDRAACWLAQTRGAEGSLWRRLLTRIQSGGVPADGGSFGWAWVAGTNSWVEPTSHALVALRRYLILSRHRISRTHEIEYRVQTAERMLLGRRCPDGGWNYGAPEALGIPLESFPETTAMALIGLQQSPKPDSALNRLRQWPVEQVSPLGAAWLRLARQLHNLPSGPAPLANRSNDVLLTALECLGENSRSCRPLSLRGLT
ncbi:MAG: terpene cyclase/mutase family protein [Bryobacterales bacterium]|nr:terpene cyclase/mutase family protein [Bryobacterales bacterium]